MLHGLMQGMMWRYMTNDVIGIKMIKRLRKEMRKHTTLAISGAFALVIALTWNETIKKIVESLVSRLNLPENFYWHQIIVALIVTVICIIGIMVSSRYSIKEEMKR